MRRRLVILLTLTAVACGQSPPGRDPLPDVAVVVPEARACSFVIGDGKGVNIEDVINNTGAEGVLETGDLLTSVGGVSVRNADELRAVLSERTIGESVTVNVVREGAEVSAEIVLAPNPDVPDRPLLGVLVSTAFDRVAPADLEGQFKGGDYSRAVSVAGEIYLLDPETGAWAPLNVATPDGNWVVAGSAVLTLTGADAIGSALVDAVSGDRMVFEIGDWNGSGILGSLESSVVMVMSRPIEGDEGLVEVAVMLVDFDLEATRWIWPVTVDVGYPLATFPSPSGNRLLIVSQDQETRELGHLILTTTDRDANLFGTLPAADGSVVLGWLDEDSILATRSPEGLIKVDVVTGEAQPFEVPATLGTLSRLWPVGNGDHLLAQSGVNLVEFDIAGANEVRTLADHCLVDVIGDIGWKG